MPDITDQVAQGRIFRDAISDHIEGFARVRVHVDNPEVNVGYEVGYALGRREPTAPAAAFSWPSRTSDALG